MPGLVIAARKSALVFTGPGDGNGVPAGTRTALPRDNLHRIYHTAVARVTDPAATLAYTPRRVLRALREAEPGQTPETLRTRLAGRQPTLRTVARRCTSWKPPGWQPAPATARRRAGWRPTHPPRLLRWSGAARSERPSPYLLDLAGGRRHPGPGDRRADGPRGHSSQQAATGQRHGRPPPAETDWSLWNRPGRSSSSHIPAARSPITLGACGVGTS